MTQGIQNTLKLLNNARSVVILHTAVYTVHAVMLPTAVTLQASLTCYHL